MFCIRDFIRDSDFYYIFFSFQPISTKLHDKYPGDGGILAIKLEKK